MLGAGERDRRSSWRLGAWRSREGGWRIVSRSGGADSWVARARRPGIRGGGIGVFMNPSGFTGVADYGREPGSNGLTLDPQGRLVCCEHGDRRISRLEWDGGKKTLVDHYQGRWLNSPNDVVFHSNGDLYF